MKLFYKRDNKILVIISNNRTNSLKVGDILTFSGYLYSDAKYTNKVADSKVIYRVVLIDDKQIMIKTKNIYDFKNGKIMLSGYVYSNNFKIKNGEVQPYTIEDSFLSIKRSVGEFADSYGIARYAINGAGVGEVDININTIKVNNKYYK